MNEKIIEFVMLKLAKAGGYDESSEQYSIVKYTFSSLLYDMQKTVLLFIISCFLGKPVEYIVFITTLYIIRKYSFGFHAKSNFICMVLGLFNYMFSMLFIIKFNISFLNMIVLYAICYVINLFLAPYPDEDLMTDELSIHKNKIKTLKALLIPFAAILLLGNSPTSRAVLSGVITETFYIIPFDKFTNILKKKGG